MADHAVALKASTPPWRDKIAYVYLMRVPIMIAALLILLPCLSLPSGAPLNALFGTLFALGPTQTCVTTICALLLAWSLLLSLRLVLLNGEERFGVTQWLTEYRLSGKGVAITCLIALPLILGQFFRAHEFGLAGGALWKNVVAVILGGIFAHIVAFIGLLAAVFVCPQGTFRAARAFPAPEKMRSLLRKVNHYSIFEQSRWESIGKWIASHVSESWTAGYIDRRLEAPDDEGELAPNTGYGLPWSGHWVALTFALSTFLLYIWIDVYKKRHLDTPTSIPALAFVLILFLNLNWVLAAMAFFLDRFRVPLIVPLIVLAIMGSYSRSSDHYFETHERAKVDLIYPYDDLKARIDKGKPIVIVATAGGGIQASAWTAQVLSGLQLQSKDWGRERFADSITLISAVSGGAVGSMFFANGYGAATSLQPAGFRLPIKKDQNALVEMASASSLDDVAWGLVYRDIPQAIFPYGRSAGGRLLDRGRMLELSWKNRANISDDLSKWRTGVIEGWRPALIFNATIAETGEPILLGTTDFRPDPGSSSSSKTRQPQQRSLRDILPPLGDVPVVTAVRLASSFPYVAPAARPQQDAPEYHLIDGGYYDNYGVQCMVQWLDQGLTEARQAGKLKDAPPILIVQIRSFPNDALASPKDRGWFYQAYAPLEGLLSVRTTAQLVRDRNELLLLREKWKNVDGGPKIVFASFVFPESHAPLSWKMTDKQVKAVKDQWKKIADANGEDLRQVRCMFLQGAGDKDCPTLALKDPW